MTLEDYLHHYLVWGNVFKFFVFALLVGLLCIIFIVVFDRIITLGVPKKDRANVYNNKMLNTVQRFYGVIFSGASILSFLSCYYLLDHFLTIEPYRGYWDKNKDFLLLVMIVISIILNNIIDRIIIPLKKLDHNEKSSLRVVGMIYVILIFIYIKYIYENNNYDGFIMYFLGLVIGRFVYFDASFRDFINIMKSAILQVPVMILGLCYTSAMCYVGFKFDYLLKSNGVLVSCFIAHIFMIVSIFILHHSRVALVFSARNKRKR